MKRSFSPVPTNVILPRPNTKHHNISVSGTNGTSSTSLIWTPIQRIHLINDYLSYTGRYRELEYWETFVSNFFDSDRTERIGRGSSEEAKLCILIAGGGSNTFDIPLPLIAKFFWQWYLLGLMRLSINTNRLLEFSGPAGVLFDSPHARICSIVSSEVVPGVGPLQSGIQMLVEQHVRLRILFNNEAKIKIFEMSIYNVLEYLRYNPRNEMASEATELIWGFPISLMGHLEFIKCIVDSYPLMKQIEVTQEIVTSSSPSNAAVNDNGNLRKKTFKKRKNLAKNNVL